jgi:hypothetical protein
LDKYASTIMLGNTVSLADIDTQLNNRISLATLKNATAQQNATAAQQPPVANEQAGKPLPVESVPEMP